MLPKVTPAGPAPLPLSLRCESEYQADAVSPDGQYYSSTINSSVSICAGFTVGAKSLPCEGDSGVLLRDARVWLLLSPPLLRPRFHKLCRAVPEIPLCRCLPTTLCSATLAF